MTSPLADHLHSDPGDGRSECPTCGKWVWLVTHSCKGISVTPSPLPGPAFIGEMPPSPETSRRWWTMYCRECGIEETMYETPDDPRLIEHRDAHNRDVHGASPLPTDEDARVSLAKILTGLTDREWAIATAEGTDHLSGYFDAAERILAAGWRRSVVSTPGDAREAVLTSLRRSHVGEMVSKIPEAHRRMVAEGIFDALSAVSAPPTITDEAARVTLAARRGGKTQALIDAMLAQAKERGIAVTVVPPQVTDETVHQALLTYYPEGSENKSIRDWPVVLVSQMRAALVAALGGEDKVG